MNLAENMQASPIDWGIGPFIRPFDARPVITPNPDSVFECPMRKERVQWESMHTFNPAAVVRDGKVFLLYRAEDNQGKGIGGYTSRLGLAESEDGIHFKRHSEPVLYPEDDAQKDHEWFGGCEDPRIVELEDGTYVLFYTQFSRVGDKWLTKLGRAISTDLIHWEKKGPVVIRKTDGGEMIPRKSASLVCGLKNGRLIASKIDDRYWMYYGEGSISLTSSEDLENWREEGGVLMEPRKSCFDSGFPEGGPPAVLTDEGIVLLYNGKNGQYHGDRDPRLNPGIYCGGQALFDTRDPKRLLARPETPFFKPEKEWEATGQYGDGTTFIEGLVFFQDRWFLYYGCADSFVGVAIAPKVYQPGGNALELPPLTNGIPGKP